MGVLMIHHCGTTSKSLVVELVEVAIGTGCAINATRRSRVHTQSQNSRGKWTPRGEAYAVVAVQRNVLSLNLQRKYGGHEAHKKN
ncbi:hypothetical protein RJ639_030642 [Escallonia herrerae]|uniref:Uncharacterized protein n=1 Tax=Escallonia herrerae TaxID=1293975 RepID=A0AA88VH84_9ASTE|nr:hypothetical protein RJ639_015586 [Escallonia herrerae]KAK3006320.1 hypothetical protein RJ639_015929 [Escallonia herrerae]KAK3036198.1 hypothetical protein RJ639_030642 [Escallonia herrerae]